MELTGEETIGWLWLGVLRRRVIRATVLTPTHFSERRDMLSQGTCRWGKSYLCALLPNLGVQCQWNDAN